VVGYLLHWGLFGTLSIQLYLYYLAFPKDRKSTKCLVYGVYIVEFVQMMLLTHDTFVSFGYGFGDLEALNIHLDWLYVPIMGGIGMSSICFCWTRLLCILNIHTVKYIIHRQVSLISFVASVIAGVCTEIYSRMISIPIGILCAGYALCDIIIAICMTYYLMRSSNSFHRTQLLVTKLVRLIIETGSLTAAIALVISILFFVFPHEVFYVTPALIISKLYANTIYMVLNSRIRIMGGQDTYTSSTDVGFTTNMMGDINSHSMQGAQRTPVVVINEEVFSSNDEMGGTSVSYFDSHAFLELISPQEKLQDGDMSILT
ncbi:hypothetical protein EDD18DRAFT_1084257, partial [Armillaria luteobubalina]